jgi:hypothetical protein
MKLSHSSGMYIRVLNMFTDVSEVRAASHKMEGARPTEK